MSKPQNAKTIDLNIIRDCFEANFYGTVQTTQTFLPLILKAQKGYGAILNISTDMASNTSMVKHAISRYPNVVAYNTSKAAQNSYTIALAHELKPDGIKVNAITPGHTMTKLNGFRPGGKTAEEGAAMILPWALLGPEDEGKTGEQFLNACLRCMLNVLVQRCSSATTESWSGRHLVALDHLS